MIRRVNKGLTIIEVLIVLAVSTSLAVISIGAFSSRGRTQDDDAARQVLADIALVRNQAQQGQGPTTDAGRTALASGSELFGQAIIFTNEGTRLDIKKLAKDTAGAIYIYEENTIENPQKLAWNTASISGFSVACANTFISCYDQGAGFKSFTYSSNLIIKSLDNTSCPPNTTCPTANRETKLVLVFKNGTGESYALTSFDDNSSPASSLVSLTGSPFLNSSNYTALQQGKLRLVLGKSPNLAIGNSKSPKYFINFDLAIPNNQELEVFK